MGTASVKTRRVNKTQKGIKKEVGGHFGKKEYKIAAKKVSGAFISNIKSDEIKAIAVSASAAYSAYKAYKGSLEARNRTIVHSTLKSLGKKSVEVSTRLRKSLRSSIGSTIRKI